MTQNRITTYMILLILLLAACTPALEEAILPGTAAAATAPPTATFAAAQYSALRQSTLVSPLNHPVTPTPPSLRGDQSGTGRNTQHATLQSLEQSGPGRSTQNALPRRSDFIVAVPPATPTVIASAAKQSPTPTVTASETKQSPAPCIYQAAFLADVTIPDGTQLAPGAPFTKTWRLQNAGTCAWGNPAAGLRLTFAGGERLDGPGEIPVPPVAPGEAVDLSLPLTAPAQPGSYTGHWRLEAPTGAVPGGAVYLQIAVTSSAAAATTVPPAGDAPPATEPPAPAPGRESIPRLALLNYFAWYDVNSWDGCNISAGDRPLQPYNSDDPAAIARHLQTALAMGADGFTLQWFAPGDRTDRNLETLLNASQGSAFRSTVVFLRHIWPGGPHTQAAVAESLRYLLDRYADHPNFLTLNGRPVLFITDVYRVPRAAGQTPQDAWATIRAQADPAGNALWIAEGLDPSYLAVFDGLWVYKITHAAYPDAYLKAAQWAAEVRRWEAQTGRTKLWIATISPGWDDLNAGCRADVRVPSPGHKRDRADGAFYQATFDAALASGPDWLWVNSFNEWVEGTYVEPGAAYGEAYVNLTRELLARFKGN